MGAESERTSDAAGGGAGGRGGRDCGSEGGVRSRDAAAVRAGGDSRGDTESLLGEGPVEVDELRRAGRRRRLGPRGRRRARQQLDCLAALLGGAGDDVLGSLCARP